MWKTGWRRRSRKEQECVLHAVGGADTQGQPLWGYFIIGRRVCRRLIVLFWDSQGVLERWLIFSQRSRKKGPVESEDEGKVSWEVSKGSMKYLLIAQLENLKGKQCHVLFQIIRQQLWLGSHSLALNYAISISKKDHRTQIWTFIFQNLCIWHLC